jgi:PAS domain S-box-containing protein
MKKDEQKLIERAADSRSRHEETSDSQRTPEVPMSSKAIAQACAWVTIGIALLGLVGWALDWMMLAQIRPGFIPIAPSSALAFVLLGAGLLACVRGGGYRLKDWITGISASLVICLVTLCLLQLIYGFDVGLEHFLLRPAIAAGRIPPHNMSPLTALALLLVSLALLSLRTAKAGSKRVPSLASFLAVCVLAISFMVLLGYAYGTPLLYGGTIIPVALPTAVVLFLLSVGLIAATAPLAWPIRMVLGTSVRARLLRTFLPTMLFIVVAEGWLMTVYLPSYMGNPALLVSLMALISMGAISGFVILIGRVLGGSIDRAHAERSQVEMALRESERRLSTLISNLPGIVYRCKNDPEWTMEFISTGCLELTGYAPGNLTREHKLTFNDLIHPEHQERCWTDVQTALEERRPYQLTYRIRTAQGHTKWVWEQGRGVFSDEGTLLALEGFITDITESMRTEQERRVMFEISEALNQTANLDELLHRIHLSLGRVVCAENCFIALFDKKKERFEFPYFVDQFDPPPDPIKVGRSRTAYVFRTGQPILMTARIFQELVQEGEVELVGTPPPVWMGVPLRAVEETIGVLVVQHYSDPDAYTQRDLEFLSSVGNQIALAIERKRSEEQILLQKARFQSLFENAPIGIVMLDEKDRILRTNQAFEKMFEYSIDEIQGKFINEVVVPSDLRPQADEISRKNLSGIAVEMETIRQRRDGTRIPVQLFGVPLLSEEKHIGTFAIYADLTESKQLTDQLRQAHKMEAIGRLAGGVAHDFNNLLTSIIGYSQLVLGRLGEGNPLNKNIEEVVKAGERAARLTSQLLAFSRKQVLQPVVLNLNTVVSDVDKMLRRLIGEDIELITALDPDLGCVKADSDQISQIILNLAVNSRDAMPRGGKLIIETSEVDLDETYCKRHSEMRGGHFVRMAISDTGCGMDRETLSHVFEPFYTTKERGKGTGLGLSMVYGIVKQSDGTIEVYSELGVGTTFKVYFPRVVENHEESQAVHSRSSSGTETILVVEDEEGVRNLVRNVLEMNGYGVLEAGDADNAMELFDRHKNQITLLLTDVIMPKTSGVELVKRLKVQKPGLKVLFMSGYTDDALTHHGILNSDTALLEKPFTPLKLAQRVRQVLDT